MMDINTIYNKIKERFIESDYLEIVNDLERLVGTGASSNEILFSTGKYLYDLKIKKPLAYEIIKDNIDDYLEYCRQYGIIIK